MLTLRPATAADQSTIIRMVREAELNPRDLNWRQFLVVADGQQVVGIGQVKAHFDGSRELASLAVHPEWQGRKLGDALMYALLAREGGQLHLMCLNHMEPYYRRFGFRRIEPHEYSPYFWRMRPLFFLMNLMLRWRKPPASLLVMRRG